MIDFSSRRARRCYLAVVASAFLLIGTALTLVFSLLAVRERSAMPYVALVFSLMTLAAGVFQFKTMLYDISFSEHGVEFSGLTGSRRVLWANIEWYWPWGFTGVVGEDAGLWVLFKYFDGAAHRPKSRLALMGLNARGPGFGSIDEFMTDFDRYVPAKRRRGIRHS